MLPPLLLLSADRPTLAAIPWGDVKPPLAPNERKEATVNVDSSTKRRALRGAALLCGCNILACLLALLVMLPHQQPFRPSLLLYCTVWLWWSIPVLLPVALVYVAVPFCTKRGAVASSSCVWRRLCLLAAGPLLLALACGWYFGLEEHGVLSTIPLGDTGFLKLCHVWCGGGPWAIRSPCYQKSDTAWRNNITDTEALAFFQDRVFGPAGEPVAARGSDGRIALSGLPVPVAVQHPGRRTLLISSGVGAGWEISNWSHVAVPFRGRISEHAARLNAVAALLRGS